MRQRSVSTHSGGTGESKSARVMCGRENTKHENRSRADWTTPVCVKGAFDRYER